MCKVTDMIWLWSAPTLRGRVMVGWGELAKEMESREQKDRTITKEYVSWKSSGNKMGW